MEPGVEIFNPQPLPNREEAFKILERHKGQYLTDEQVIDFISGCKSYDYDASVTWLGGSGDRSKWPIERFSQILADHFENMSPDERVRFLSSASRFVLGGVRFSIPYFSRYRTAEGELKESQQVLLLGNVRSDKLQRNIGELLVRALEVVGDDVEKARKLLAGNYDVNESVRESVETSLVAFIRRNTDFVPERVKSIISQYLQKNPKIAELACLVALDLNVFSAQSSPFYYFLDKNFASLPIWIKTHLLTFLAKELSSKYLTFERLFEASEFLNRTRAFYEAVKAKNENSPFLHAFDMTKLALNLSRLQKKTNSRISADELADLLERNQNLIKYVSKEELEMALNSTSDHRTAMRIERAIRIKKSIHD